MVVLLSTTPISIGSLVTSSLESNTRDFSTILFDFLKNGELFIYCMSIVGSIAWLTNKDWPRGVFPPRIWLNLIVLGVFGVSLVFFGVEHVKVGLRPSRLLTISIVAYAISIVTYYVALTLNKVPPPDVDSVLKEGANKISEALRRRASE